MLHLPNTYCNLWSIRCFTTTACASGLYWRVPQIIFRQYFRAFPRTHPVLRQNYLGGCKQAPSWLQRKQFGPAAKHTSGFRVNILTWQQARLCLAAVGSLTQMLIAPYLSDILDTPK